MDDSEFVLKKLCCTCLSRDRNLSQLCRLQEGINNLYLLLSYDSEAYIEGFYKDTASWYICWECWAIMMKISKFRSQACLAQKQLSNIVEGRADFKHLNACLSHLTFTHKTFIDLRIVDTDPIDNFIDCGPNIKAESDDDIPLSTLHNTLTEADSDVEIEKDSHSEVNKKELIISIEPCSKKNATDSLKRKKKIKCARENKLLDDSNKYFKKVSMSEDEMLDSRVKRKLAAVYTDAMFKCESCIEGFKSKNELDIHVAGLHVDGKKSKLLQCDLCLTYVKKSLFDKHKDDHYLRFECQFCDVISYNLNDILSHLKMGHSMQNLDVPIGRKKGQKKSGVPGSKPWKNQPMMDKTTPYLCTECNKYFVTKNQRWKHVQRHHREGYKCSTCGKRFAFKNNLSRHEQMHQGPPPREECQVCHKMVRVDLVKIHAKIHTQRDSFRCAECDKCFVSRASYEHHLKYTQAHAGAAVDILKYKCSMCDKGYRSRGELRDHINYKHMDKTQHKCPICEKALATRRCITRHVKRAHKGLKEYPKNKICQQCGKAFRIEYQSSVICQKCHYFLKRMGKFKQQVEHSLMILNKQGSNIDPLKTFRDLQLSETLILSYDKDEVVKDLIQTYTNVPEQQYSDLQTELKIENDCSDEESFMPLSDVKEMEKIKKKDKSKTENKSKKKSSVFEKYEGKINIIYITDTEMLEERRQMATKESYLKLPYKCEKCITAFDHEITLKDHMDKRHGKKKNGWVCSICESVLVSEPSFKEHMKRHKRRYECQECGKRSTNVYSVIKHYNEQHGIIDAKYTCADCDFTTTSNRTYRYHRDKHKQKQQCTLCDGDFVNATSLKMHMLYVHKLSNRVYKCEECDKVYNTKSGIAAHKATAHSSKRGFCAPCGTYYRTANSLAHHLRTHSAHVKETDKRFICDDCGSKFLNKSSLQAHIDFVHLKNTKYKCTKCYKVFISGPALKKHENFVHKKIRPPRNKICHHCGRGFTTSTILRSHVRTHTGERPLQCNHCTATFAHSAALYTHTKLLHAPNKGKK